MSNGMGDDTGDGMGKDMNGTNNGSMDDDTGGIDMHEWHGRYWHARVAPAVLECADGTDSIGMHG